MHLSLENLGPGSRLPLRHIRRMDTIWKKKGDMFIVRVQGGLGNQLFQYALARSLSHKTGKPFKLDFTSFTRDNLRKPELHSFRSRLPVAGRLEISRLKYGVAEHLAGKLMRREPRPAATYVREKAGGFDPSILALEGPAYLDGYWQSEKYFGQAAEILRVELSLREALPGPVGRWEEKIRDCEAVAVHVRRGDYVANPTNHAIFNVCGEEYYLQSADYMRSSVSRAKFFLFSDDPAWVRENLAPRLGSGAEVVEPSPNPVHDLHLMSRCRHNIIANSTFSWWAAWLNPNPGKIVMAPRMWFREAERESSDIVPSGWKRMF
jgi:hypothetical protein